MKRPTFDPYTGSGDSILVATVSDETTAKSASLTIEERRLIEDEDRNNRELRSLMGQRHSFAG